MSCTGRKPGRLAEKQISPRQVKFHVGEDVVNFGECYQKLSCGESDRSQFSDFKMNSKHLNKNVLMLPL